MAWNTLHVNNNGFVRIARTSVRADAYGEVQIHLAMKAAGGVDRIHAELLKSGPVANHDICVDEWNFDGERKGLLLPRRQFGADIWDHDVPTREDASLPANGVQLTAACVSDFDRLRSFCVTGVCDADDGAVEADARLSVSAIEGGVFHAGGYDIDGVVPRDSGRHQRSDEEARDGRVAIGEMEEIFFAFRGANGIVILSRAGSWVEVHAFEAGESETPRILRRDSIDPYTEEAVWACLKQFLRHRDERSRTRSRNWRSLCEPCVLFFRSRKDRANNLSFPGRDGADPAWLARRSGRFGKSFPNGSLVRSLGAARPKKGVTARVYRSRKFLYRKKCRH